jgi:sodium/hydrogen antiporter
MRPCLAVQVRAVKPDEALELRLPLFQKQCSLRTVPLLVIFIGLIFLYGLGSARLERTVVTGPIVFCTAGMCAVGLMPEIMANELGRTILLHLAEVGLVLLLFTDASRTELRLLKSFGMLPTRLLSVGMLLTILLGGVAAWLVFPRFSVWEAGILAAILAPTDAGLGQVIVTSELVPLKIREALNVEAGLNDGLSVPFLLFFIALTGAAVDPGHASLARFIAEQLGLGALIGLCVGLVGSWLLAWADRRQWIAHSWRQLGVVALPLLCLLASLGADASMFIAAFVAGLAVQVGYKQAARYSVEFTEEWGQILNLAVFFIFGVLAAWHWHAFEWKHVLYAVLSLTIVRMLPVAISLLGTKLSGITVLFVGWFGPRGLASIVLGLVYLEQTAREPSQATIRLAVIVTVLCSIFAHGFTALPGMGLYARALKKLPPQAPEFTGITGATTRDSSRAPLKI